MSKALIALSAVCMAIALLSPIAVYLHFSHIVEELEADVESYRAQLANWPMENEELKKKIREHMEPFDPYLMEPYLATSLGWYLHNSSDPVPESRNKLTIYGQVLNIGAEKAYKCKLKVTFYKSNMLVQTSEINLGTISYWGYHYTRENINCKLADAVTRIEVERFWSKTP